MKKFLISVAAFFLVLGASGVATVMAAPTCSGTVITKGQGSIVNLSQSNVTLVVGMSSIVTVTGSNDCVQGTNGDIITILGSNNQVTSHNSTITLCGTGNTFNSLGHNIVRIYHVSLNTANLVVGDIGIKCSL